MVNNCATVEVARIRRPPDGWHDEGGNGPKSITDILFYSASAITTSGGGGFVPKSIVPQAFTVFEIACGLILLVVCFAVYAGGRTEKPSE